MLQLVRYGLVGIGSNVSIYLVYIFITYLGVDPKIAMTLVFIVGALIGFVGNRRWTFTHYGSSSRAGIRFLVSYAAAYTFNLLCMWFAVDRLGVPHYLVQAVNVVLISLLLFIAQKYWIFAPDSEDGIRVNGGNPQSRGVE